MSHKQKDAASDFSRFAQEEQLSARAVEQFEQYITLLLMRNEQINLTAITKPANIMAYHFQDSLYLDRVISLKDVNTIADIGTGAGFPAIPLKIKYPHLSLVLIEVTLKKVAFLKELVAVLGLENVTICTQDWRTFLRTHDEPIDMFVARASLQSEEMLRMFRPSSAYQNSSLVYWAGSEWAPTPEEKPFVRQQKPYVIKGKRHQLVFFGNSKSS
jgi:16S rRNA (guanine(527)-N(7))-methyltransferase RsmG